MILIFCLLLLAIYFPQPEKKRVESDLKDCRENLKQIYSALLLYQEKYGVLPPHEDTDGLRFLFENNIDRDLSHFVCPGTTDQTRGELREDTLSYYYFPPENGKAGQRDLLLCDHPGNHPGGVIQFMSGDGVISSFRLNKPVMRKDLPSEIRK